MTKQQQQKQKKTKARTSNPVSYNLTLSKNKPLVNQRLFTGKDIIVPDFSVTVTTFGSSDHLINPRLEASFPSASLQSQRYDMYQFEELKFHYHPTSAVTTTPGVVILAWEPNANKGPPETLQQINAFESHSEGPAYSPNLVLSIPKNKLGGPRYTRYGPVGSDLNLYDTGKLIVAHDKCSTTAGYLTEGYIEVYYKIKFFNYHLEEQAPSQARCAEFRVITPKSFTTGMGKALWFDSVGSDFGGDPRVESNPLGYVVVPPGKYLVDFYVTASDSAIEAFNMSVELQHNSAALSPPVYMANYSPVGGYLTVSGSVIVEQAPFDSHVAANWLLDVTLTGAAGTLNVIGSRMVFSALS
jgi:hypothetical protein